MTPQELKSIPATISIAGSALQKDLGIGTLGHIFPAFGWAYAIG